MQTIDTRTMRLCLLRRQRTDGYFLKYAVRCNVRLFFFSLVAGCTRAGEKKKTEKSPPRRRGRARLYVADERKRGVRRRSSQQVCRAPSDSVSRPAFAELDLLRYTCARPPVSSKIFVIIVYRERSKVLRRSERFPYRFYPPLYRFRFFCFFFFSFDSVVRAQYLHTDRTIVLVVRTSYSRQMENVSRSSGAAGWSGTDEIHRQTPAEEHQTRRGWARRPDEEAGRGSAQPNRIQRSQVRREKFQFRELRESVAVDRVSANRRTWNWLLCARHNGLAGRFVRLTFGNKLSVLFVFRSGFFPLRQPFYINSHTSAPFCIQFFT